HETPSHVSVGKFLAGGGDGLVVAGKNLTTGAQQLEVFNNLETPNPPGLPISMTGWSINDVIAADFTHDGLADIAVANGASDEVDVFINNAGSFIQQAPFKVGSLFGITPTLIGAGTFEDNPLQPSPAHNMDLVVVDGSNPSASKAYVFQGQGDGTFKPFPGQQNTLQSYAVGLNPTQVVVGDFEGNGIQDITILNSGDVNTPTPTPGTVTELSGLGNGTFRVPTNFDVGLTPTGMVSQFFPGETSPVLVVSNALTPIGTTAPINLRINLRQLSARRSNGIAITGNE